METKVFRGILQIWILFTIFGIAEAMKSEGQVDVLSFFPTINGDVSRVTWAHGVNNLSQLEEALQSDVLMLEADVSLGHVIGNEGDAIPIMAHPPLTTSDISLEEWLVKTTSSGKQKGIKLDFKNVEIVEPSLKILANFKISSPLFLNADILHGPVNASATPVNAITFLSLVQKNYPHSTLSIGWTTKYDLSFDSNNFYSWNNVVQMSRLLKENDVKQSVTFPIRASFASNSYQQLRWLVDVTPNSSLTIWSAKDDPGDISGLARFLENFSPTSVYYDLHSHLQADFAHLQETKAKEASVHSKSEKLSTYAWHLEDGDCALAGSEAILLNNSCLAMYMDKFHGSEKYPVTINGVVEFLPLTDPNSSSQMQFCGEQECAEETLAIGLRSDPWIWVQIFNNGSINKPMSSGYRRDIPQSVAEGDCYRFRIIDSGLTKAIKFQVWRCSSKSGSSNYPPIGNPVDFEVNDPETTDTIVMALSSKGTRVKVVHSLQIIAPSGSSTVQLNKNFLLVGLLTLIVVMTKSVL